MHAASCCFPAVRGAGARPGFHRACCTAPMSGCTLLVPPQETSAAFAVTGGTTLELTFAQYWSRQAWFSAFFNTAGRGCQPAAASSALKGFPRALRPVSCADCHGVCASRSLGDASLSAELFFHGVQITPAKVGARVSLRRKLA